MSINQISLYYKDGSSYKSYHVQIEQVNDSYVVNFQYGRGGRTLTTGTKTKDPVDLAKAEKVYENLVNEQKNKGYTKGELLIKNVKENTDNLIDEKKIIDFKKYKL